MIPKNFRELVDVFLETLSLLVYFIIALTTLTFVYGIILYISRADDESKRKEGAKYMMYGIIGLFVMLSVWGLVNLILGTFGLDLLIPQFN